MKNLIIIALCFCSVFALDDVTKPTTFTSNTTARSSEVNSNFDTLYNAYNKLNDTLDLRFVRFGDFADSTIGRLRVDTISSNPVIDSIRGPSTFTGRIIGDTVIATSASGLALFEDGGSGIFVEDGGNVGIGTTNPSAKLQVKGNIAYGTTKIVPSVENYEVTIGFFNDTGGSADSLSWVIGQSPWGNTYDFVIASENGGAISPGTSPQFLITKNGYVGIGTASPSSKLTVDGAVSADSVIVTGDIYTTDWTDYRGSTTYSEWTSRPTGTIYYKKVGDIVYVNFDLVGSHTSASVLRFSLPYELRANHTCKFAFNCVKSGGGGQAAAGGGSMSDSTVSLYTSFNGGVWTTGEANEGGQGNFWFVTD